MSKPNADSLEIFDDQFDKGKLTVPELRRIFLRFGVGCGGCSKKAELLALFNKDLSPRGPQIIAETQSVVRSAKGIKDVIPIRFQEKMSKGTRDDNAESDEEDEGTESESEESESTGSESIDSDESTLSQPEPEVDGTQSFNPRQDPLYTNIADALRSRNAEAIEESLSGVKDIWSLSLNMVEMAIEHRCDKDIIVMLYERYEKERSSDKRRISLLLEGLPTEAALGILNLFHSWSSSYVKFFDDMMKQ